MEAKNMIGGFFSMRLILISVLFGLLFATLSPRVYAQKQLVLLKREKIFLRLHPGDDIVFRLKGSKIKTKSYINNLFDTAILVHRTIIPFYKIDRIYFKKGSFMNVVGGLMVIGGAGYFAIDQLNETVVHGHSATLNKRVTKTSVAMVILGLPLMIIRRHYARVNGRFRLLTAGPDSPFYLNDIQRVDF
ncbi:MAG: hypothetical protein ABJA70_00285 [Chryseolinea sp.]